MTTMFSLILASCGSWGSAACWQTPNSNSSSVRWAGGKTNLGTCRAHLHAFRGLWVLLYLESVRSRKHRYRSISRWKMYDFLFRIVVFTLPPEVPKPMINGGAAGFPLSFPCALNRFLSHRCYAKFHSADFVYYRISVKEKIKQHFAQN